MLRVKRTNHNRAPNPTNPKPKSGFLWDTSNPSPTITLSTTRSKTVTDCAHRIRVAGGYRWRHALATRVSPQTDRRPAIRKRRLNRIERAEGTIPTRTRRKAGTSSTHAWAYQFLAESAPQVLNRATGISVTRDARANLETAPPTHNSQESKFFSPPVSAAIGSRQSLMARVPVGQQTAPTPVPQEKKP